MGTGQTTSFQSETYGQAEVRLQHPCWARYGGNVAGAGTQRGHLTQTGERTEGLRDCATGMEDNRKDKS